MKLRIGLFLLVLFLTGCGPLLIDYPAVGPDGTVAVFLIQDEEREPLYTLIGGTTLTLIRDGVPILSKDVVSSAAGAVQLAWAPTGDELVYIEEKTDDEATLISSTLYLTDIQSESSPVPLMVCEVQSEGLPLLCQPAFTPAGDITYLRLEPVDELPVGHLVCYDHSADVHETLLENVLSYLPATESRPLTVVQAAEENDFDIARVFTYDPASGEEKELASFVLTEDMLGFFYLFPPAFLWDVSPSGEWVAVSLPNPSLLTPELLTEDFSVYLIEPEENDGFRLTHNGLSPAFSPDEMYLAYIGPDEDEEPAVILYNLETEARAILSGTENTNLLFWINPTTLGLAVEFETDDWIAFIGVHQLLAYNVETGELTPLLESGE